MSNNLNPENSGTALAISSSAENVGVIVRQTPECYQKNQLSHDNCLGACRALLDDIEREGMSDELDQKAAKYIDRTKRTIKVMNELRAPVTKLFDRVRAEFTSLENDIDPTREGTVTHRLQQLRNQYAEKKRKEEEARKRAEEVRRQAELARDQYRTACENDFKAAFNNLVVSRLNELTELNSHVTLENYTAVFDTVTGFSSELNPAWRPPSSVRMPLNLSPEETRDIREQTFSGLLKGFQEQYATEIGDYRQEILDRLPSRLAELERAAKASAEEAAKIKEEIRAREEAEATRKEQERIAREQEEAKKAEARKAGDEAASLFSMASMSVKSYSPKTKVTKRIKILNPNGYMQVLSLWWAKEGCRLSEEDLNKVFKKQISFCEKLANSKDSELITDPSVEYIEEVKAQ